MSALLMLAIAGTVAAVLAAVWRAGFQAGLATAPECVPAPVSALVSAAEERVKVRDARIAALESVSVAPAEMWSLLPWQEVPSRVEVSTMQALADHNQYLEAELDTMHELLAGAAAGWAKADATRQRHWNLVKSLRLRLAAMVPVEEFAHVEDLRTRSLSVAKSAASRAADHAALVADREQAINEITQIEAMDLNAFNLQLELILTDHGIEVGANT